MKEEQKPCLFEKKNTHYKKSNSAERNSMKL